MGGLGLFGRHAAAGLGLVALVAVVYGGSVSHDFVFDDWELVVGNGVVTWPLSRAQDVFEHGPGGVSYRPVRMISYMVDHWLGGGLNPRVFHTSNLVYHAMATLLLYGLAVRTIGKIGPALFAAALFAIHPLGSEAVVYVAGRRDLLSGMFALLGLLSWWSFCEGGVVAQTRAIRVRRAAALTVTIVAAGLALGAKENAAVFPALALLLFVLQSRRHTAAGGAAGATAGTWVALALAALALYVIVDRFYLERVYVALARMQGDPLGPQPALSLNVLGRYGLLSVWPVHLYADYRPPGWTLPTSAFDAASFVTGLVLASALSLGAWLVWRGRVAGAGLLWFPIALLPVLQIVPYREIVAEHNAYLPLAGLALAAGDGAAVLLRRWPRGVAVVAVVLVVLLGARAHARTMDWRDDETLWTVTLEQRPASVRAKHNLASALARRGQLKPARQLLREARQQSPREIDVLESLATIEGRLGNDRAALALAKRAARIEPSPGRLLFLGWVQLSVGEESNARRTFRRVTREDRGNAEAWRGLRQLRERDRQRQHLQQGGRSR